MTQDHLHMQVRIDDNLLGTIQAIDGKMFHLKASQPGHSDVWIPASFIGHIDEHVHLKQPLSALNLPGMFHRD